jgi:hypothetical protein
MEARAEVVAREVDYPVYIDVRPAIEERNRLTSAFRFFLALPHVILVGGPVAVFGSLSMSTDTGVQFGWGAGGLLGFFAGCAAIISWFAILLLGRQPDAMRRFATYYLRWRIRSVAYLMLLRDEYPPFGDDPYPAELALPDAQGERNRLTVLFRIILAVPHLILLWGLSLVWAFTTTVAWVMILVTGRYPETLYGFAIGVLAWIARVEAYMLLLRDEYPPFTLRA